MEEVFSARYFYAAEMWQLIHDGITRRNPSRDILFEKARKMLREYVEKRDDEKMELEFGLERYRVKLNEARERVQDLEATTETLRTELTIAHDRLANLAERLDEEHEEGI